MSFRDQTLYQRYAVDRHLVLPADLMTHGIVHGKLETEGAGEETLREWSDYVVMYYGRGVQLKEIYITPSMMTPRQWQVLGEATRWAVRSRPVLQNSVWVGGDPRKGEAGGYVCWQGDRGILTVRNPDIRPQDIAVPFDKSVYYRGKEGRVFRGRVIYPYVEAFSQPLVSGQPIRLSLPGATVMVIEMEPGRPRPDRSLQPTALAGASARIASEESGKRLFTASLRVPDEPMQRCDLMVLQEGGAIAGSLGPPWAFSVNDQPVKARQAEGDRWSIDSLDLTPFRGKTVAVSAEISGASGEPFGSPQIRASAWLVADRPVTARPAPRAAIPYPIAQGYRRQTVSLLPETDLSRPRQAVGLTDEDLHHIRAARLSLWAFDSNGEPAYRDKFILLNGHKISPVSANQGRLSAWQRFVIDLTPGQLGFVRRENRIVLTNAPGECYKFTGLALAVRKADGTWAESEIDATVHSSVSDWMYSEGVVFQNDQSGEVFLTL